MPVRGHEELIGVLLAPTAGLDALIPGVVVVLEPAAPAFSDEEREHADKAVRTITRTPENSLIEFQR
jgi:hypothetical protein